MKISAEGSRHLTTAQLLLEGVQESMAVEDIPRAPEHSVESIIRRIVQARQELLRVAQEIKQSKHDARL